MLSQAERSASIRRSPCECRLPTLGRIRIGQRKSSSVTIEVPAPLVLVQARNQVRTQESGFDV